MQRTRSLNPFILILLIPYRWKGVRTPLSSSRPVLRFLQKQTKRAPVIPSGYIWGGEAPDFSSLLFFLHPFLENKKKNKRIGADIDVGISKIGLEFRLVIVNQGIFLITIKDISILEKNIIKIIIINLDIRI